MMNPYCGRSEAVRELLRGVYSYSFGRAGIDAGPYGALFGGMQVFVRRCVGIGVGAGTEAGPYVWNKRSWGCVVAVNGPRFHRCGIVAWR